MVEVPSLGWGWRVGVGEVGDDSVGSRVMILRLKAVPKSGRSSCERFALAKPSVTRIPWGERLCVNTSTVCGWHELQPWAAWPRPEVITWVATRRPLRL